MSPNGAADPYVALIEQSHLISGRYKNPKPLGGAVREGNFSLIFRAEDTEMDNDVALKFFHPNNTDPYRREAFSREAQLLAEFRGQPNILQIVEGERVFEVAVTGPGEIRIPLGMSYFVTELGHANLKDYIYSKNNNARNSLILFREICKGVQRIHRARIVHRDLKPPNLLLFPGLVVKLCDFGTTRRLGEATLRPRYDFPVGDMRYTAVELFCGMGNNPQHFFGADFFSLGAILFELFTRQILTQIVYDLNMLRLLNELFTQTIPDRQREERLNSMLPSILSKWSLPNLSGLSNLAPPSIRGRVDSFYKRLADLDYRNRAKIEFPWIFREIEICLKILNNEETYRRLLEVRRRRQPKR